MKHSLSKWSIAAMPLRIAAPVIYAVIGFLWVLGGDLLLATVSGQTATMVALLGSSKATLFIACSAIALYALLRHVDRVDRVRPATPIVTITLLVVTAVLVVAGSHALFRLHEDREVDRWRLDLAAAAEMRARRMGDWLAQHVLNTQLVTESELLADVIQAWREQPDEQRADAILGRLNQLRAEHDKEILAVSIVSADGSTLFSTGGIDPTAAEAVLAKTASRSRQAVFGAPRDSTDGTGWALISVAAPVGYRGLTPAAIVIVTTFDMRAGLDQSRPSPGAARNMRHATQLVYAKDGVTWSLNEQPATGWQSVMAPPGKTAETWLPGQVAAAGNRVIDRATDDRGVEVLAAVSNVAGTDLYIVTKADWADVQRDTLQLARIGLAVLVLTGLSVVVGVFWIRRRVQREVQDQVAGAEQRLVALTEHFELANINANDIILLVGPSGRILQANERAIEVYGYSRAELLGLKAAALRAPGVDEGGPTLRRFGDTGTLALIFETQHRRKDGSIFPVEISARRFRVGERDYSQSIVRDITKRREREAALAALSHERDAMATRLRMQFDGNPLPCAVSDANYCMLDANPAFERLFGWSKDELLGRDNLTRLVPPKEITTARAQLESVANSQGPTVNVHRNITRDGRMLTCRWTDTALRDEAGEFAGTLSICEDLSGALALKRELNLRSATFETLAESAPVGVFQLDARGAVTYANSTLMKMFGYGPETLGELVKGRYLEREDWPRAAGMLRDVLGADPVQPAEFRYTDATGVKRWLLVHAQAVFSDSGKVLRVVGTATDITRLKEQELVLEQRVAERTEEFRAAKDLAERATAVKTEFLAGVSHELRTPLNSVVGFTEVLLEKTVGPLNDRQEKQLTIVRDAARRLRTLISDLLDISRIESGRTEIRPEPVAISELVGRVVEGFELDARRKGLALHVDTGDSLGEIVTDAGRVEQILGNLVSNAIKYTAAGSVSVRTGIVDGEVLISVSDTGVGIDPAEHERIFNPFVQLQRVAGQPHDGVGLGLAISRKLAEALGGSILVESTLGVGSAFRLRLPATRQRAA